MAGKVRASTSVGELGAESFKCAGVVAERKEGTKGGTMGRGIELRIPVEEEEGGGGKGVKRTSIGEDVFIEKYITGDK